MSQRIQAFFDEVTSSFTYIVWDDESLDAVVIDPVLDFDPINLKISETSINQVISFVNHHQLNASYLLETHIHADHITGAARLRSKLDAQLVVSSHVSIIQKTFTELLDLQDDTITPDLFDVLLDDQQVLTAGSLKIKAIHTPGHTPACTSYLIGDALFVGDSIFMPDFGTGRCDFPHGSADILFESITQKLYMLPDQTRVFVGHDYQPNGRILQYETSIKACKTENIHINQHTKKEDFIAYRTQRDATLNQPKLLFPSVQLNIRAGQLPTSNTGTPILHIPILGT